MLRAFALVSTMALTAVAAAAPPPGAAREIGQLIDALGSSGCEFQRNGRWYDAERARAHLRRKLDWLLDRDLVASAEQFIERAGSRSSISGRPYRVRCPGTDAEPAAAWLQRALDGIRERTPSSR